jgi:general secretion pathway protein N
MKAATQRRLTPPLVLLAAVLGMLLVAVLLGVGESVHWPAPRTPAPLPPVGRGSALPAPQPLDQYALVWQKPLFSPDRRPAALADADSAVGDLALTGVIITPQLRMALAHDKSNDRDLQIEQGKSTPDGRWTLVEVHPRSAVFDAPGGRVELKLPAGAPFDKTAAAPDNAPGKAEMRQEPPPPENAAPGRAPAGRAQRARQSQGQLQAERLRRLNAIIQKRRAEQAASTQQGAH